MIVSCDCWMGLEFFTIWTWKMVLCVCCICHLRMQIQIGISVCYLSLQWDSDFYQTGITSPRYLPILEDRSSIFNILPNWLPRSRGNCFPSLSLLCCLKVLTWKQEENTLRSSPRWLIFCQLYPKLNLMSWVLRRGPALWFSFCMKRLLGLQNIHKRDITLSRAC